MQKKSGFFKRTRIKIIISIVLLLLTVIFGIINFNCALVSLRGSTAPACMPTLILTSLLALPLFVIFGWILPMGFASNIPLAVFSTIIAIIAQVYYYYLLSCLIAPLFRKRK